MVEGGGGMGAAGGAGSTATGAHSLAAGGGVAASSTAVGSEGGDHDELGGVEAARLGLANPNPNDELGGVEAVSLVARMAAERQLDSLQEEYAQQAEVIRAAQRRQRELERQILEMQDELDELDELEGGDEGVAERQAQARRLALEARAASVETLD